MSDESDNMNELLLETIVANPPKPACPTCGTTGRKRKCCVPKPEVSAGYLEQFAEMVRYMVGVCAVNLTEPSDGDLKRLADSYHELFRRCYAVSLERDAVVKERDAAIRRYQEYEHECQTIKEAHAERDALAAQLAEVRRMYDDAWKAGGDRISALEARNAKLTTALERILNEGNMAAQGHWDATDKMKGWAFEALAGDVKKED